MKKFLLILLFSIPILQDALCQDKINTKDKKQLNVNIIEQTHKVVRYKMTDYEDGPIISLKTSRISRIEYKNGFVDQMGYQNPRKSRPLGINAGAALELSGGGGMFSTTVDYFIIPQLGLEVNAGTSGVSGGFYFSAGGRIHINSNYSVRKITPFTGVLLGSNYGDEFVQIPFGINYLATSGFNTSLSINRMIGFTSWYSTFAELRAGWKFKSW
jgi:hypothetical protein